MKITDASLTDIPTIQHIARETWPPTYAPILPDDQIQFMLDAIYSYDAISKTMIEKSQEFILLEKEEVIGFAAYGLRPEDPTVCKIHKLYVLPEHHGNGYGRILLHEIRNRMKTRDIHILDLNVYRLNGALQFYQKEGFRILREERIPMGPYTLDDFVMRLEF